MKTGAAYLARNFGSGVDETVFYGISTLRGWQRRRSYITKPVSLENDAPSFLESLVTPAVPDVTIQNQKMPLVLRPLANRYRYTHLTFASAVTTGNAANDTVHAHHLYRADNKTAPTLLYLHGWHNFDPAISLLTPLREAQPLEFNVVLLELPHHMHRAAPNTYSGELALTADLNALLTTVRQSVSDTRALAAWLRARGIEHLALEGQSLGGGLAAMVLTVEGAFDCAVLFVPAVEPAQSLWHSTYTHNLRQELSGQGLTEVATAQFLEALRPAHYQPLLDPNRILIVAATGDRVAFRPGVENLARAWHTQFSLVEWGHLSSHWRGAALRQTRRFLKDNLGHG